MAGEKQEATWPLPKFHFRVSFGDKGEIAFQEVSGLDAEYDIIEYRSENNVDFSTVKMPGLRKTNDVTLKKGMFKGDTTLFDYFTEVKMNTIQRETVTIHLLDEEHNPMFTWTLQNAYPMKVTGTDLNAQNSEVAVEELVLAHEGLSFEKA
ncbi:MAG: phage tail protein [Saprospiraceae bacterium]|nr:phage tail protein [Saprospiraceae bacterium]